MCVMADLQTYHDVNKFACFRRQGIKQLIFTPFLGVDGFFRETAHGHTPMSVSLLNTTCTHVSVICYRVTRILLVPVTSVVCTRRGR